MGVARLQVPRRKRNTVITAEVASAIWERKILKRRTWRRVRGAANRNWVSASVKGKGVSLVLKVQLASRRPARQIMATVSRDSGARRLRALTAPPGRRNITHR